MNVIDNVLNTQVFFGGYVIDNNDPLMLGRVRIVPENDNKEDIENAIKDFDTNSSFPDVNGPWSPKDPLLFLPLLPVFINPVPKIGEYVNLFYQYRGKRTSKNKFYIQGPLSTPVNLKSDDKEKGKTHLDAGSRLPRPQNIKVNLSTEASKELFDSVQRSKSFLGGNNDGKKSLGYTNDKTKGVYPEPGDNSLLGRGSADIVIKENETIIRAGKYKNFNPPNMPDADGRRAFLQLSKFDFTKTKGTKKSRKRLNKQDKFLKYLIEYNIYNPENLQNNFRGDITLYKLPSQVAQTNTANFDVDTVLSSNLTVSSYILNFNNKTIDEVISLVNNFIVDFKDGVLTDTFIPNSPLSPGEQFPFYFRPKNSLLNFINNFDVNNDPNTTKNVGFILSSIKINDFDITPGYSLVYNEKGDDTVPFQLVDDSYSPEEVNTADETVGLMGAKKLFLLSNTVNGTGSGKKPITFSDFDIYGIDQDTIFNEIEPNTSSMVRGEELIELLNLIVKFLITHVHPYPGLPPVPVSQDGTSSQDILKAILEAQQKILNGNIRIN